MENFFPLDAFFVFGVDVGVIVGGVAVILEFFGDIVGSFVTNLSVDLNSTSDDNVIILRVDFGVSVNAEVSIFSPNFL